MYIVQLCNFILYTSQELFPIPNPNCESCNSILLTSCLHKPPYKKKSSSDEVCWKKDEECPNCGTVATSCGHKLLLQQSSVSLHKKLLMGIKFSMFTLICSKIKKREHYHIMIILLVFMLLLILNFWPQISFIKTIQCK